MSTIPDTQEAEVGGLWSESGRGQMNETLSET
jgi:hypothetical protein